MLNKVSLFSLSLTILLFACAYPVIGQKEAPVFTLVDIDGNQFSLLDYRGRIVLIDLFRMNPSCPPCIYEIPHLKAVYNKYSRSDFIMMSISVSSLDTDDALRRDFVEEYGIPWIVACGVDLRELYSVSGVPTLVIVDSEGDIRYRHEGVTEESTLISEIDSFFVTILSPRREKYATTSVPLNFTLSKAASWIRCSLDGGKNVTISGNTNLTDLADGPHIVTVCFQEDPGNTIYSNSVHFSVDITPQPWISFEHIVIIGVAVISLILVSIVAAGKVFEWSKPAKKRRKHKH